MEQLPYKPDGYNYWDWKNYKVHYVVQGQGPPVVLIHGFGASAFHWRSSYSLPLIYLCLSSFMSSSANFNGSGTFVMRGSEANV